MISLFSEIILFLLRLKFSFKLKAGENMKKLDTNYIRNIPRKLLHLAGIKPFFNCNRVLVIVSVTFPFCKAQNFPLNGNTDHRLLPGQTPLLQDWYVTGLSWHCLPPHCGGGLVQLRTRLCNPPPQVTLQLSHAPQGDKPPSTIIVSEVNTINMINML